MGEEVVAGDIIIVGNQEGGGRGVKVGRSQGVAAGGDQVRGD